MATELELKLMLQSEYLTSASDFLDEICAQSDDDTVSRQPTLNLMNAYYDTEDGQLMSGGMALRIRAVNDQFIQTVKTRGTSRVGMHARGEWEWQLENDCLDLSLLKAVPLPDALAAMTWSCHLQQAYRTDFERQVWLIQQGDTMMEVVCDQGKVTSPYGEDSICELELELKSGPEAALYEFALRIAECVPVQVSVVSKAQKGVRLKQGQIEFPQKPIGSVSRLALAAYWYEVWLIYWEAMFFMQDEVLLQPFRHTISQLRPCLPAHLDHALVDLDNALGELYKADEDKVLELLGGLKSVGSLMLKIGQWLNQQSH
ncbi:CYTH domain-containing protein [Marinomonas sp. TW1]|uniref:CYTH domain-containing protein n=1 Tax=Marinomonas sp. TW1 TaxID=1561203 RepID=UPI0007AFC6A0|nr:CYTH domain-containing protein [Marinomonas sp. TW1]KZN13440.1 adenylate cyclase [Marinomonas sp. TW1]